MDLNQLLMKLKYSTNNKLEYYKGGKKIIKHFSEVYEDVIKVSKLFKSMEMNKGDRIAILGKNSYEWIVIDLACVIGGIITLPLEIGKKYDIEELRKTFDLKIIVTDNEAIYGEDRVYSFNEIMTKANDGFNNIIEEVVQVKYNENDCFTIISTSGTSGQSKFGEVSKQSFDHLISRTQELYEFVSEDRFLVFLPLNIYLERCYVYSSILIGFDIILTPLEYIFHSIQNDKPSVIIGIPYFFENFHNIFLEKINAKWINRLVYNSYLFTIKLGLGFLIGSQFKPFVKAWGGNIRYLLTGAAPIRQNTLSFYEDMGIRLYEGYGMSEVGGMITLNSPKSYKRGSVGKPFPDKLVTLDEQGQILVKSKYNANTSYLKANIEENSKTYLADGTIATGDIGYFDENGFLYINGRVKDLIVTSTGKKIHPTYVEEHMINSGCFSNCVVYGDNKPYLVALLVPKDNDLNPERIKAEIDGINDKLHTDSKIINYAVVREKFTTDNKLLTNTYKVSRVNVYRTFEKEIAELYE